MSPRTTLLVKPPAEFAAHPRAESILLKANHSFVRLAANCAKKDLHFSKVKENLQWTDLQFTLNGEDAKALDSIVTKKRCVSKQRTKTTNSKK
jgi:hypothetical protein